MTSYLRDKHSPTDGQSDTEREMLLYYDAAVGCSEQDLDVLTAERMRYNRSRCHPYPLVKAITPSELQLGGGMITVDGVRFEPHMAVRFSNATVRSAGLHWAASYGDGSDMSWVVLKDELGLPMVRPNSSAAVEWWRSVLGNATHMLPLCDVLGVMARQPPPPSVVADGSLFGFRWASADMWGRQHARFTMWAPCAKMLGTACSKRCLRQIVLQTLDERLSVLKSDVPEYADNETEYKPSLVLFQNCRCPQHASCKEKSGEIWPHAGYLSWRAIMANGTGPTPPHRTSIDCAVKTCDFPKEERCAGGQGSPCGAGYAAPPQYCSLCAAGYFTSNRQCLKCNQEEVDIAKFFNTWFYVGVVVSMYCAPFYILVYLFRVVGVLGALGAIVGNLQQGYSGKWLRFMWRMIQLLNVDLEIQMMGCDGTSSRFVDIFWAQFLLTAWYFVALSGFVVLITAAFVLRRLGYRMPFTTAKQNSVRIHARRLCMCGTMVLEFVWFISVKKSLEAVACSPATGSLWIEPAQRCFDERHTPVFVFAVVVLLTLLVGYPGTVVPIIARGRSLNVLNDIDWQHSIGWMYLPYRHEWILHCVIFLWVLRAVNTTLSLLLSYPVTRLVISVVGPVLYRVFALYCRPYRNAALNTIVPARVRFFALFAIGSFLMVGLDVDRQTQYTINDIVSWLLMVLFTAILVVRTIPVAATVTVHEVDAGSVGFLTVPFSGWPVDPSASIPCPSNSCNVWLFVNGGDVTEILEQFTP